MKKSCYLLFLLLVSLVSYGQEYIQPNAYDLMGALDKSIQIPQSPEVAAFQKYGDTPVNLYSGTPNINVPIYSLQGNEMSVPISLTYDASGIKVDQIATNIGLGWNLNFGGVVSRSVNHLPDDLSYGDPYAYTPVWNSSFKSFQDYVYNNAVNKFDHNYSSSSVATYVHGTFYEDYQSSMIDTQADTFSFNVGGLSGKIIIEYIPDGNGSVNINAYCFDNPDIKVETTSVKSGNTITQPISGWTITNTDGTQYQFQAPEITWNEFSADPYFPDGSFYQYLREYYSAWYLTKIISPNGLDVFDFEYSAVKEWDVPVQRDSQKKVRQSQKANCINNIYTQNFQAVTHNRYKQKQFHLTKIKYNTAEVLTTQVAVTNRTDLPGLKQITGLTFKDDNGNNTLQVDFDNNDYFRASSSQSDDETNTRLKLDGISFYRNDSSKARKYTFTYFNEDQVPSRYCNAVDFWGYHNNSSCNNDLAAIPPSYVSWPFTPSYGTDRSPFFNKAINGTIKTITYPTGGYSEFTFEPHQGFDSNNQDAINGIVGGIRVKKIEDYENSGILAKTKYYFYNDIKAKVDDNTYTLASLNPNMLNSSYQTSGVTQQPLVFWETKLAQGHQDACDRPYYYQYPTNLVAQAPNAVTYSSVSELIFRGSSFEGASISHFYNDSYGVTTYTNQPYINRQVHNGELHFSKAFDSNLSIISESENVYSNELITNHPSVQGIYQGVMIYAPNENSSAVKGCLVIDNNNTLVSFSPQQYLGIQVDGVMFATWDCSQYYNTPVHLDSYVNYAINKYEYQPQWKKLERSITKNYVGASAIIDTVSYAYNSTPNHYFTTHIETTDSKGLLSETQVMYPLDVVGTGDYTASEEIILNDMISRNMIAGPVLVKKYYNSSLLSTQKVHNTVASTTSTGYDVIRPSSIEVAKSTDALETRREYHSYDSYGNLTEVSNPNGTSTYYIWGYHGKLLLAEIKNKPSGSIPLAVQNLIDSLISDSDDEDTLSEENALRIQLDAIRNQSYFDNSMVTTYTYDPGIGVTSVTDPKGYVMYYEYDQHNRLVFVRDADNNLVGKNEYSYRVNN
ncbi:MAG: hypothetical protein AAF489_08780 [Bacteroidota bacterium]